MASASLLPAMIHRFFQVGIVLFWGVMTFLLIRSEIDPEQSGLLNVPLVHVVKMLFIGGQISELAVTSNHQQVGNILLRPRIPSPVGRHCLEFSGNLAIALPFVPRQRIVWEGEFDTDVAFHITEVKLIFSLKESANKVFLDILPPNQVVQFKIKQGDKWVSDSSFAMNKSGISALLKSLDFDETKLAGIGSSVRSPEIVARRSSLKVRDERIESYLVSVRQGDLSLADIYVTQLGQILFVRTSFGYTMGGEDITP